MKYLDVVAPRYRTASKKGKGKILDELCRICGYTRKHAIARLHAPLPRHRPAGRRPRPPHYAPALVRVATAVWRAAGYPWSARLKVILRLWQPWIQRRFALSSAATAALCAMSPRTLDYRLRAHKVALKKRLYGRTKPGTLLRRQIPIQTSAPAVTQPGFVEVDLVAHCGPSATGDFCYTVNLTDLFSGWVESRAVLGKGDVGIVAALDAMRAALPFRLVALDSDNGSEFVNHHLLRYCQRTGLRFTRSRPYKKDDNAHIEQKNWTHVRKLIGWDRYDTRTAGAVLNALYTGPLRIFMNLFQPSVRLVQVTRRGSHLARSYDAPQTPLDRLLAGDHGDRAARAALQAQRARTDPFELADRVQHHLARLWHLPRRPAAPPARATPVTNVETETLQILGRLFGTTAYVRGRDGQLVSVGQGMNS